MLIFGLYIFCLAPGKRRDISFPFKAYYFAHRGLFDAGRPENSLAAFQNAANHGFGIELDVQLTRDNKLVVFHDEDLKRMCGIDKKISDLSFDELKAVKLGTSNQTVPLFADVLKTVNGAVPLIVEIKPNGNFKQATYSTLAHLKNYKGEYCVESFNPMAVRIVKKKAPHIVRGQLSSSYLIMNVLSRPDFVAYYYKKRGRLTYKLFRKIFGGTTVAWTVKSQEQLKDAKKSYDCIIFDSFIPEE